MTGQQRGGAIGIRARAIGIDDALSSAATCAIAVLSGMRGADSVKICD